MRTLASLARAASAAACLALVAAGCSPEVRYDARVSGAGDDGPAELRLSPDPAFANARLGAVFTGTSPAPATCRYEWRRNGERLWGANGPELDPSQFRRGDRILVRVVDAGEGRAPRVWVAETKVINSPPQVTTVAVALEVGSGGAELRASVQGVDPDGDAVKWTYEWTRDGAPLAGAAGATLPASSLSRGDRLAVTVSGDDGEASSAPVTSEPFVLDNRPPAFTSTPDARLSAADGFEYRAMATDPDGDPLRYELASGPDGATISADGWVRWQPAADGALRGEVKLVLRALDPAGAAAVQEIVLRPGEPLAAR